MSIEGLVEREFTNGHTVYNKLMIRIHCFTGRVTSRYGIDDKSYRRQARLSRWTHEGQAMSFLSDVGGIPLC